MATARKARKKTAKKPPKPSLIKVRATVTIETSFQAYEHEHQDSAALEQIKGWIIETLCDEEYIPLFVATRGGEQTNGKKIKVVVEQLNGKTKP